MRLLFIVALLLMTFSVKGQTDSANNSIDTSGLFRFEPVEYTFGGWSYEDYLPYVILDLLDSTVTLRGRIGNDWVKVYWQNKDGNIFIEYDEKDKADR